MKFRNIENFEDWNERMAKKYKPDEYHRSPNLIIKFIEDKRVKKVIDFLDSEDSNTIIELGCGAGNIMEKVKFAKEIWGVDLSIFLLDLAQKKKYQRPVKFIKANIENLPDEITKLKFDKIYCSEVLEHVKNPNKVLGEIEKITKSNSIIVISIPNDKLIYKIKNILQKLRLFNLIFSNIVAGPENEWHIHSFNIAKLKGITENSFIIERIKRIPFNFLPLHYIVKLRLKIK